ncbi:response regulator [Pseudomarimonas arenosa]|uniref:Response regulator n=1 Tax=Pseudomarimonas arenosa TaxID=2774145 RepID=A0AAW3ZE72_9GAMM|nr:response regulator [Pseudomarimonas arenosa]MBD8524288.1 response regulator [Pseudomarimonas arenosa]
MSEVDKPRVLIVDDNNFNIGLIRSALYPEFKLMVAHSGRQGLKIAMEFKPDLVLLDVMMPDLDGYKVCAALKEHEATRHIPVVFLSSLDEPSDAERGLQLGAVDFLHKPFRTDVVLETVRMHVGKPSSSSGPSL